MQSNLDDLHLHFSEKQISSVYCKHVFSPRVPQAKAKVHRSVALTMSNGPVLLISASRSTEGESATSPGLGPFIAP